MREQIRPPPGSLASAAIASSIAASSCTGASLTDIPKDGAAASIAALKNVGRVVSGLKMTATRVSFGFRSRQRVQNREMVSAVHRQQASRKTPFGPRPGIFD